MSPGKLGVSGLNAYCQSKKVTIRRLHTDNAKPHASKQVVDYVRDEMKARYTTIAPHNPRAVSK